MIAVKPVNAGEPEVWVEIVLAENQKEYEELPVAMKSTRTCIPMVSRWQFSPSERKTIAEGGELIFAQLTGGTFQPIHMQIVRNGERPDLDHL